MFYDILLLEMIFMEIKTGYLYHIKDEYFDFVNDENLMQNHEKGKKNIVARDYLLAATTRKRETFSHFSVQYKYTTFL